MADTSEPATGPGGQPDGEPRRCPWCSAAAPEGATHCSACGASLAERESLDGLAIPGVTVVDPDLTEDEAGTLTRLTQAKARMNWDLQPITMGPSASITAYVVEKVLDKAQEFLQEPEPEEVGEVSEAALTAAARLDQEEAQEALQGQPPTAALPEATAEAPAEASSEGAPADAPAQPAQDPWSDLPPPQYDPWAEPAPDPWAGAQSDPWANQPDPWANAKQDPWATSPYDPFSVEGGPWTRDLWEQTPSGSGPDKSPEPDNDGPESGPSDESQR